MPEGAEITPAIPDAKVQISSPAPIEAREVSPLVVRAVNSATISRRSNFGKREAPRHCLCYPIGDNAVNLYVSDREYSIINRYVETLNIHTVALEHAMSVLWIRKFLQGNRVSAYVAWRTQQKASALALTVEKVMANLNDSIDGVRPLTDVQIATISMAVKILRPSSGTTINMQNNFGRGESTPAVTASPYSKMAHAELINELREVLVEVEPNPPAQAAKA